MRMARRFWREGLAVACAVLVCVFALRFADARFADRSTSEQTDACHTALIAQLALIQNEQLAAADEKVQLVVDEDHIDREACG